MYTLMSHYHLVCVLLVSLTAWLLAVSSILALTLLSPILRWNWVNRQLNSNSNSIRLDLRQESERGIKMVLNNIPYPLPGLTCYYYWWWWKTAKQQRQEEGIFVDVSSRAAILFFHESPCGLLHFFLSFSFTLLQTILNQLQWIQVKQHK